jgi:hypothetical protein
VRKRDDLGLLGTIAAPEQHQELEDTAENEVEHGPEHKQRGCLPPEHARATNPQVKCIGPGFRTHMATAGAGGGKFLVSAELGIACHMATGIAMSYMFFTMA